MIVGLLVLAIMTCFIMKNYYEAIKLEDLIVEDCMRQAMYYMELKDYERVVEVLNDLRPSLQTMQVILLRSQAIKEI